ncbi:MAG: metalloregulator ArsR/SmtB family transcription factor [Actinomycetia bacterium]|nr:metalloregulator ArsR/SmtB family transcription factor [Actinomycetes bacterium]
MSAVMAATPPLSACCPSSLVLLDEAEAMTLARVLKAVADPVRLRLLHHVAAAPDTTVCACHLPAALGIGQPTLSHHLKKLVEVGLVTREQRGRWAHYRLNQAAMDRLLGALAGAVHAG